MQLSTPAWLRKATRRAIHRRVVELRRRRWRRPPLSPQLFVTPRGSGASCEFFTRTAKFEKNARLIIAEPACCQRPPALHNVRQRKLFATRVHKCPQQVATFNELFGRTYYDEPVYEVPICVIFGLDLKWAAY